MYLFDKKINFWVEYCSIFWTPKLVYWLPKFPGYGTVWVKVFKNGPSKICGRQPLKHFRWSILEYLDPYISRNKQFYLCLGLADQKGDTTSVFAIMILRFISSAFSVSKFFIYFTKNSRKKFFFLLSSNFDPFLKVDIDAMEI